jgi:5-methylcytosine-specific restriction protein A
MRFTDFHKKFFSAKDGSFSRVTDREVYDSQITVTDFEASLLIEHFGLENIHIGNVKSNDKLSRKHFKLYPDFEDIFLNLVFPKPNKTELRLYLSARAKFKPNAGSIWFLYLTTRGEIVIGSLNDSDWARIGQFDDYDDEYQKSIEESLVFFNEDNIKKPIGKTTISSREVYSRNPIVAITKIRQANYTCEINSSHQTFISLATKMPYVEAHHFIPMKYQSLFEESLDVLENIICLCPNCHRGIHLATVDYKIKLINHLYKNNKEIQKYPFDKISQFYNCETPDT